MQFHVLLSPPLWKPFLPEDVPVSPCLLVWATILGWEGRKGGDRLCCLLLCRECPRQSFPPMQTLPKGKKKKRIQNNAQQCREKTDQASAVQLYSDPTKTLDYTPSFPSHTQNMHQSAEDGNCGMTHTQHRDQHKPRTLGRGQNVSLLFTLLWFWKKKTKHWYLIAVSFNA